MKLDILSVTIYRSTEVNEQTETQVESDCSYLQLGADRLGIAVNDCCQSGNVESSEGFTAPQFDYYRQSRRVQITLDHGTGFRDGVETHKMLSVSPISFTSARRLFKVITT